MQLIRTRGAQSAQDPARRELDGGTVEAESVQVRGAPVAVRRRGTGPALVYLHDEFVEHDTPLLDHLRAGFEVTAPDLPGFGDSPRPEWVDDVDDMAYHLADLLETLAGGDRVRLAGAGLGGW